MEMRAEGAGGDVASFGDVSLVVANRQPSAALVRRLTAIAERGVEVLVVTPVAVGGAGLRRIVTPEAVSLGGAYNLAAGAARRPVICFATEETAPSLAGLEAISLAATADAEVVFAPRISWGEQPRRGWADAFRRLRPAPFALSDQVMGGPTIALRRAAFMAAGGFDERLGDTVICADLDRRLPASPPARRIAPDWRVEVAFPASLAAARRLLRAEAEDLAELIALHGGEDAERPAEAGPLARWERAVRARALIGARTRHRRETAGGADARRGLLSFDALATTWGDRPAAPHLRAPASWPCEGGPRLSVVVPSYRRPAHLTALLDLLVPQARAAGAEIVVVDDGSGDSAYAAATAPFADVVVYHRLEQNLGRGAATNAGIARASGAWVVFTDDDVRPPEDWLATLAAIIGRFPDLDAVGGVCRPLGRERRGLIERFTLARPNYVPRPYFARGSLKCMITACLAVRADTLARVGGIDKNFVAGQDHNLTWRLRKAGARIHVTGDWWVAHDQDWRLRDLLGRLHAYAYWHVRQTRLSGEPIDYLFGPHEDWTGLLSQLPAHLRWVIWEEARSGRPLATKAIYVVLDMLSHLAWSLGGIAGRRAAQHLEAQG